jgi:uncharacterized damage-inducible protein DinB
MLAVMFSRELLLELLRHMEWADAKVWDAVPDASPADRRLAELLVHTHVVQRAFLTVWTGGDLMSAFRRPEEFAALSDLRVWAQTYYAAVRAFVGELSADRLAAPLVMPWADQMSQQLGRPIGATSIGETAFQVTSHSTYHRGQINARLRELGSEPPLVDYIAWLWFGRPAPQWRS